MKNYKIGVIGGSGVYSLKECNFLRDKFSEEMVLKELFIERYILNKNSVYFIPRHGKEHSILPHEIDYLANISQLKEIGVDMILSFCTVGSLDIEYTPGTYIIPTDLIDATHKRKGSEYVKGNNHVDMRPLFNEDLVSILMTVINQTKISSINKGTLVVVEGPRFSTMAEQYMYQHLGGSVLNMTQAQEIYLSHVFKIPFVSLCHVTDFTPIVDYDYDIYSHEAIEIFKGNRQKIEKILSLFLTYLEEHQPNIEYNNKNQSFV